MKLAAVMLAVTLALASGQSPAVLHCERKTYPGQTNPVVIIYITGGVSNVQYQIFTPYNRDLGNTNWSYTHRMYSRDFLKLPEYGELIVSSRNDPNFRPRQFYRIGGILPD